MRVLHKLNLLLWKNMKMIQRHWLITIFEMFIPIGLFALFAWINANEGDGRSAAVEMPASFTDQDSIDDITYQFPSATVLLYYTPANNFTTELMERVRTKLTFNKDRLMQISSESELEAIHNVLHENSTVEAFDMFGVIFEETNGIPKTLKYKIRCSNLQWRTTSLFPGYQYPGPMKSSDLYFRTGFIALQYMIDSSYIGMIELQKSGSNKNQYPYVLQEFPYPKYTTQSVAAMVFSILPACINIGFIISLCMNLVKQIVADKRTGVTELMKLMGLTRWMLWFGWLLKILMVNLIVITVIVFLLKVQFNPDYSSLIQYSNAFLLWIFLVLFCIAATVFTFFFSTLFYRPVLATCFGAMIWIVSYLALTELLTSYKAGLALNLLSAIFPNMAMYWGFTVIGTFESAQIGANWSNLFKSPTGSASDMKLGYVFLMLIFDILFYGLLTSYIDAILPGHYGVAQPWNFFLTKSFWLSRKVGVTQTVYGSAEEIQKNFEAPLHGLKTGIRIKNLHKMYSSGKVAVDGVTLDIYQDQITALLGHNGAGKTTTMSILTGMLPPTTGSVFVNDYDIRYDLAKVRESLGLCPQHDMLFNELTVTEHLIFFGMLKGLSRSEATTEASILLTQIQLSEKANSMSSQLSGGMKRKLSLGIALIGGSKVVILDEPTSGLDPEARRHIWDLLLSMRGHRTIIITTHFMEEADVLGDRIAIMDHGRVQCYGTSLFLKNQYGAGYILKFMVKEHCDIDNITNIVQSFISNAKVKSKLGTELTYSLPSEQKSRYPELFDAIENKKEDLGITSIGVSITTMEEVFLKVGNMASDDDNNVTADELHLPKTRSRSSSLVSLEGKPPRSKAFVLQQLEAVFTKKLVFMYRKWILLTILVVISILMTLGALELGVIVMSVNWLQELPLTMSLAEYGDTDVLYYVPPGGPDSLARSYEGLVRAAGSNPISVPEPIVPDTLFYENETALANELLKVAEKDISYFKERLIVAAMFNSTNGNAMYSSIALHGSAISVNLINNALLRSFTNSTDYSITTVNHPLMYEMIKRTAPAMDVALILHQLISLGTLFLLGYFSIFPLLERVSNAKQLQLMTGLNPATYWLPCFVCDFFIFTLVSLMMVLMLPIVDTHGYFGGSHEMGVFLLLLLMYGLSGIPFAYVFSYFAKTSANGFGIFALLNFVFGSILPPIVIVLEIFNVGTKSIDSVNVLKKFLFLLPQFSFSYGLEVFFNRAIENNWCQASMGQDRDRFCLQNPHDDCCGGNSVKVSYFGFSTEQHQQGISWFLIFMFFDMVLYMTIIVLVDFGVVSYIWEGVKKLARPKESSSEDEIDGDVKIEYTRVQSGDGDILAVNGLAKVYGWKSQAVKGVTFGVMPGECFGLLGVNGAGKTTTFKMLTGAEVPTEGDARIDRRMLSSHKSEYLSQIGYCPQFDAINETLTGREMLQLFARLRGVPRDDLDTEVEKWLNLLGLNEYQDCRCGTYSGGNKRKLSTAMALIGDPPLIFLDEPTSGVDPVARRNLWSVLAKIQKTNHSIVLTSHSMEECEALCNRLAIMVKGQFVCIGENQYLKQKFGQGFTVMIKLKDVEEAEWDQVTNVQHDVERMFPASVLKDKHQGLLHYHLTDTHIPWKVLFANMEKLNADHAIIEDYTISETTLEQLFLAFAQAGDENTTETRV